ncbi:MAG: hypothetical protein QW767_05125 [Thermoprotei archaeon]
MNSLLGRKILSVDDLNYEEFQYLVDLSVRVKKSVTAGLFSLEKPMKRIVYVNETSNPFLDVCVKSAAELLKAPLSQVSVGQISDRNRAHLLEALDQVADGFVLAVGNPELYKALTDAATKPCFSVTSPTEQLLSTIADFSFVQEFKGGLKRLKMSYVGDNRREIRSLLLAAGKSGVHFTACTPEDRKPDLRTVAAAKADAEKTGGSIRLEHRAEKALEDADVVYVDEETEAPVFGGGGTEGSLPEKIFASAPSGLLLIARRPDVSVPYTAGKDMLRPRAPWTVYSCVSLLYSVL